MSTPSSTSGIAARLRSLRGEESQASFSRRVGLTRAALANYETGRTIPKKSVLRQVCHRLGVPESVLVEGVVEDADDMLLAMGIRDEAATLPGLTHDERAIIRVLRVCDKDVVLSSISAITDGLAAKKFSRELADQATIVDDIARLLRIVAAEGFYERGISPDTFATIAAMLITKNAGD